VTELIVATKRARAALPDTLPHHVAALAAAKGAALVHGLASADPASLRTALDDVLHVPYRRSLVPGYDAVVAAARDAGAYGATLSGSGPTILAVAPLDRRRVAGDAMLAAWDRLGVRAEQIVMTRPAAGYQVE
jgi:homoserine kinase